MSKIITIFSCATALLLSACTTTSIDQVRHTETQLNVLSGSTVAVIGRRHSSDYETEPFIVDCIGDQMDKTNTSFQVINEEQFSDRLYPWFEPRTAPLKPERFRKLLDDQRIAERVDAMGVQYIVWVDGNTKTTDSSGSLSCALAPGAAGCIGFSTWEKDSSYEIEVWDMKTFDQVAELSSQGTGRSYMPAIIVPIPMIARVKTNACKGIADQIMSMFEASAGT